MKSIRVGKNETGQRLDRVVQKYLSEAPASFIHKMLRKKNITLNDKKAEGKERLQWGDEIKLWFSEETLAKFGAEAGRQLLPDSPPEGAYLFKKERIVYEDEDVLLYDKPAGLLSQKAEAKDLSLNELFVDYLLKEGKIDAVQLQSFRPSICNRLDRNTSGLLILGKSIRGLRQMNRLIRERGLKKYYLCIVWGEVKEQGYKKAWLHKDERQNKVLVREVCFPEAQPIETAYRPLYSAQGKSLLLVRLISGKSHQIRAHLAFLGHPIVGDVKYEQGKKSGIRGQLLHSYALHFPLREELGELSGRLCQAKVPERYMQIMKGYQWELGNQEDFAALS